MSEANNWRRYVDIVSEEIEKSDYSLIDVLGVTICTTIEEDNVNCLCEDEHKSWDEFVEEHKDHHIKQSPYNCFNTIEETVSIQITPYHSLSFTLKYSDTDKSFHYTKCIRYEKEPLVVFGGEET